MAWKLMLHGHEIERHPNRETCVVAAIERGWAFRVRAGLMLLAGVEIVPAAAAVAEGENGKA